MAAKDKNDRKRIIVRLELTPSAKKHLEDVCDRTGMTQVAATSRLIEWFATQSEMIQAAVLGHYPREISSEIAKIIMGKLAEQIGQSMESK